MSTNLPSETYSKRAQKTLNPTGRHLFHLMEEKKSNLCLSLDVTRCQEALEIVEKVGPHICLLKTHVDILSDFTFEFTYKLRNLAEKYGFLLFEDRKFADIGNTVKLQYESGIYRIAEWADIVNAHVLPGEGIIEGLKEGGLEKGRALLLIAQMSSSGNFAKGEYTQKTVELAKKNLDFVIGFIAQEKLDADSSLIHMTPGISLEKSKDAFGQQYNSPEHAIVKRGTDIIIVGRSILQASDQAAVACAYKEAGWQSYLQRL